MGTRITGGEYRSRSLKTPPGNETRPTGSRVREALFNIIDDVEGASFVDLYAGSGSVGIEAASRGAASVILLENARPAIQCIQENLKALKTTTIKLVSMDAVKYYNSMPQGSIDVLFCDPPFVKEYPEFNDVRDKLAPGGTAIFQYPSREKIAWLESADKIKRYGESCLAFFYN
ncbi:MAG: 16S rRNA (guanine(966)-N(2))-methyltransferase RsmD [Fibrobacterales bacterium]